MAKSAQWTPFHAQLHRTLLHRKLLPKNQRLLVAVSGGQDSLCLIKLLLDLQPKWGWQLAIAHCDHRWRPDSEANANYVEELAQSWQVVCYRQTADEILKSEAAARQWRYHVLTEVALTNHYPYIVTGHTASDRAETLLYNLVRGTGIDGLSALTWQRPLNASTEVENILNDPFSVHLIRPLLGFTRTQTAQFCQEQNLKIWEDTTNQDLQYARNRIRSELLPLLHHFNPQAELAIARTSELLRADAEYLEQVATEWLEQVIAPAKTREDLQHLPLQLNRRLLRQAPLALQRRVMRQVLQQILPIAPSFEQIEKLTDLIQAPNRSQTDPFPGGAIAQVDDPWISIHL
ncbi:MAG: tRNA lysidine(34) synthetase TilS [Actinomycetota bacterium]